MVMIETGKLIVLEGVDDIALTQLGTELCRWLRGRGLAAEHTAEPTYGPAGSQILLARQGRVQFDAQSLGLLYLADRLDHAQRADGIESWLSAGRHVLCTHYSLAAAAQLWKQVELDWLSRIDAFCRVPDLTLFVDLMPETHQHFLRECYLAVLRHWQGISHEISTIDGARPMEQVRLACQGKIVRLLELEE
jgi:thymidylate kinase